MIRTAMVLPETLRNESGIHELDSRRSECPRSFERHVTDRDMRGERPCRRTPKAHVPHLDREIRADAAADPEVDDPAREGAAGAIVEAELGASAVRDERACRHGCAVELAPGIGECECDG